MGTMPNQKSVNAANSRTWPT